MTGDLDRATRLAVRAGRVAAGLLVAFGAWQAFGGSGTNGLWLILIGWFLWSAAEQEGVRTTLQSALRGRTVETFVRRQVVVLDGDRSVADAVERIAAAPRSRSIRSSVRLRRSAQSRRTTSPSSRSSAGRRPR